MSTRIFQVSELKMEPSENTKSFQLHTHHKYEIILFLDVKGKYVVEENVYNVEPYDMMIIRRHELHSSRLEPHTKYRRILLHIEPNFFESEGCIELAARFQENIKNEGNKISASVVKASGLLDAFMRYKKYSNNYTQHDSVVLKSVIIEILYLINKCSTFEKPERVTNTMKSIIRYVNDTYMENITLDLLEAKFFVSKHYMCRAFRKATGLTVNEYIRKKRLARAGELVAEGKSLGEASKLSGFNDYSAFYRAYQKEFGYSPKHELR